MPLFFIIAIAAGAFTVGATTVDVIQPERTDRTAQAANFNPSAYSNATDCRAAAAAASVSLSACDSRT